MMQCQGRIELGRELTFTQAQHLRLFFQAPQTKRPYTRAALEISPDGRALQWDKQGNLEYLEVALADIVELYLAKWRLSANGVLSISGSPSDPTYDIVVINNRVRMFSQRQVTPVRPSKP